MLNRKRLEQRLHELAGFGRDPAGGWSRHSLTEPYEMARELVKSWLLEAGMQVRVDAAGNLIGRLEGGGSGLPVIAVGSHIDSVPRGGMYDGNLGVVAGLEAIDALRAKESARPYPMELIVFLEEEGGRFGASLVGSTCMAGRMKPDDMRHYVDKSGQSLWDAYREAGFDPAKVNDSRPADGYYKCFLELHIEQAGVLESNRKVLGVVQGIASPRWFKASIEGRTNHAGGTPMRMRKDALVAAAEIIIRTEEVGRSAGRHTVATVGKLAVHPNVMNAVPGKVDISFDVRDIAQDSKDLAVREIQAYIAEVCQKRGLLFSIEEMVDAVPVQIPARMTALIESTAREMEVPHMNVISGASHDAQLMANLTEIGMIFTPSVDGRSHCPEEYTKMEDIWQCAEVLLKVLEKLQQA